jgi:hypothetical protein
MDRRAMLELGSPQTWTFPAPLLNDLLGQLAPERREPVSVGVMSDGKQCKTI